MGFLDNSGDIILDAVLTDLGRERLARGDGSFKITKFALGDDEINYGQYNKNHASGSAYYDLEILQTPVFEAFTNNSSLMKSRLMSLTRNDILYLPVIKINRADSNALTNNIEDAYVVACDANAETKLGSTLQGVLFGVNTNNNLVQTIQGLDTTAISYDETIASDLKETQYLIEMDNRLGSVYTRDKTTAASVSFIDDDNIAFYYLTTSDTDFVSEPDSNAGQDTYSMNGPRGSLLTFGIKASLDLRTGTNLFTTLGATQTTVATKASTSGNGWYVISSIVRISGVTTGFRIDIPVNFVKQIS